MVLFRGYAKGEVTMTFDRLAGYLLATLLTVISCSICEGQTSSDTDYVVMFDTSMSMNKPLPPEKPTLAEVKLALKEMVRESWLPESMRQDERARLYFYPFDDPPEARRVFLLNESGVRDFENYVDGLEAKGSNTCIIDTLEKVLEEVPQTSKRDGRICRRQYILLTDGEENCRDDWVTQEILEKVLTNWGQELKVKALSDSLFLLRVGQFRNRNAENNFEELSRQAEKSAKGKEGTPVEVGRSAPDPAAIRKLLEPPRYRASPSVKSIALSVSMFVCTAYHQVSTYSPPISTPHFHHRSSRAWHFSFRHVRTTWRLEFELSRLNSPWHL